MTTASEPNERLTGEAGADPAAAEGSPLVVFAALLVALSPVVLETAQHVAANPWAHYAALFPLLFAWLLVRERRRSPAASDATPTPRLGWSLVALALALELFALGGGIARFARPALALAAIGAVRSLGLAGWAVALLAVWMVPVPNALLTGLGKPIAGLGGALGEWLVPGVASEPVVRAVVGLTHGSEMLVLHWVDGGIWLAALLSGLAWFRSAARGAELRTCAVQAAKGAASGVALQLGILVVATAALRVAGANAAENLRLAAPWLVALIATGASLVAARNSAQTPDSIWQEPAGDPAERAAAGGTS